MPIRHVRPRHADLEVTQRINRTLSDAYPEIYPRNPDPLWLEERGYIPRQGRNEHGRTMCEQAQVEGFIMSVKVGTFLGLAICVFVTILALACTFT